MAGARPDVFRTEEFQDLVAAAVQGHPEQVNRLFLLVWPVVLRYCRARIIGSAGNGDADDVAQEVCVALLAALPNYVGSDARFRPFLYCIASRKVVDHYRRCGRDRTETVSELPDQADPALGPEALAVGRADFAGIAAHIGQLTEHQREVLALRVVAGLSSAHAGAVAGLTPGAVRVTQRRALLRLRQAIEG